jgi:hypothetical protein
MRLNSTARRYICGPLGAEIQLSGVGLCISDDSLSVFGGQIGPNHHDVRHIRRHGDRIESFEPIVARVSVKRRHDCGPGCGAEQRRIAARFRAGREFSPERAGGARPIIDNDRSETR